MKIIQHSAIIAAVLCGTAASADVTAQQVWDNWSTQVDAYGEGFTHGDETMSGDTLTIADVRIEMSDDDMAIVSAIGDVTLTENGDGSVSITMPASYPFTVDLTPEYGDPSTINMSVSHENMVLTVSGDPEAMTYDISADSYAMHVDSLEGDIATEVDLKDVAITILDLAGAYSVETGDLINIDYKLDLGALDIDVLFSEIGGTGIVEGTVDLADLSMFAEMTVPTDMSLDAEIPPFEDGLAIDGGYSFGEMSYAFDFNADGEAASGTASIESGELAIAMDADGLSYSGETLGLIVNLLVPNEFPMPIEASMAKYGFEILVPLSQGEDGPQDAKFAFNLTELAFSDMLWNLGDPGNILPREPVTIALGLEAEVTPFFDFLDPAQSEAIMMSGTPGELNSAKITELTVRAAGAEITGDGAFTFDNSDLQTFAGFPRPEGSATFNINGVNGLVDKLIEMGLIPAEEAMMPRMMLGMFATPVGDDELESTIEVNSEGHVLANGQRLR